MDNQKQTQDLTEEQEVIQVEVAELPKALEEAQLDEKQSTGDKVMENDEPVCLEASLSPPANDSKMEEEEEPEVRNKVNEETQAAFEAKTFDPYNFFPSAEEHNAKLPAMTEEEIAFHEILNELNKCFCKRQKIGKFIGKYSVDIQEKIIDALTKKNFEVEYDHNEPPKKRQIMFC